MPASPSRKDEKFSIALAKTERASIDRAAKILGYPSSVWARSTLLHKAAEIISAAKVKKS